MTVMKRYRQDSEVEALAMANCLMLLSRVGHDSRTTGTAVSSPSDRVFECKTCNRKFNSFQALGGHRASHKKPKLSDGDSLLLLSAPAKPKTHECSICGVEFAIGQALGGHMRRHRAAAAGAGASKEVSEVIQAPVLKRMNSGRVFALDLNLTPYENDLKKMEKMTPMVHCFI